MTINFYFKHLKSWNYAGTAFLYKALAEFSWYFKIFHLEIFIAYNSLFFIISICLLEKVAPDNQMKIFYCKSFGQNNFAICKYLNKKNKVRFSVYFTIRAGKKDQILL